MNKERLEYLVNEMYYNYLEKDEAQELINYIKNLEQRIDKVNQIIDELLLMGTNEYETEEQLEYLKRVLGGKE